MSAELRGYEARVAVDQAAYFGLSRADAEAIVAEAALVTARWREVGASADVGLTERELEEFAPAFEHEAAREARALAG